MVIRCPLVSVVTGVPVQVDIEEMCARLWYGSVNTGSPPMVGRESQMTWPVDAFLMTTFCVPSWPRAPTATTLPGRLTFQVHDSELGPCGTLISESSQWSTS